MRLEKKPQIEKRMCFLLYAQCNTAKVMSCSSACVRSLQGWYKKILSSTTNAYKNSKNKTSH